MSVEILQQDVRGRVRVPARRREALLDEFERSGASGAQFARLAGIKYATFAGWVLRRRKVRGRPVKSAPGSAAGLDEAVVSAGPVRLFEAVVERGAGGGQAPVEARGFVVELPGGTGCGLNRRSICRWRRSWWR